MPAQTQTALASLTPKTMFAMGYTAQLTRPHLSHWRMYAQMWSVRTPGGRSYVAETGDKPCCGCPVFKANNAKGRPACPHIEFAQEWEAIAAAE